MAIRNLSTEVSAVALATALLAIPVAADDGHGHEATKSKADHHAIEQLREMHKSHEHHHDFEAMEQMSPEELDRMMALMMDLGLAMPPMSSERGRHLFLDKGCVACHSVNGVGGHVGPAFDAAEMPKPMNAFEFAARMWRGAGAMIAMQEDEAFGGQIELSGQELADLVAFAHDEKEQAELTADQIPEKFRAMIK